jgi:hypothetical protein
MNPLRVFCQLNGWQCIYIRIRHSGAAHIIKIRRQTANSFYHGLHEPILRIGMHPNILEMQIRIPTDPRTVIVHFLTKCFILYWRLGLNCP